MGDFFFLKGKRSYESDGEAMNEMGIVSHDWIKT